MKNLLLLPAPANNRSIKQKVVRSIANALAVRNPFPIWPTPTPAA